MSAGDIVHNLSEPVKHGIDALSIGTLVASLLSIVPQVTLVLVLFWTLLRIYDSWLSIVEKRRAMKERRLMFEASMRKQYQDALGEPVPPDLRHLLGNLK